MGRGHQPRGAPGRVHRGVHPWRSRRSSSGRASAYCAGSARASISSASASVRRPATRTSPIGSSA